MPTLKEKEIVNTPPAGSTALSDVRRSMQDFDLERFIIFDIIAEISMNREDRKISQRKLSELSGVPQKTISRVESGKDIPKFKTLMKLLNALDLNMEVTITPRK